MLPHGATRTLPTIAFLVLAAGLVLTAGLGPGAVSEAQSQPRSSSPAVRQGPTTGSTAGSTATGTTATGSTATRSTATRSTAPGPRRPAARPAPRPATRPTPASYAFAAQVGGAPVRWDPCTPIRWTSNTALGPVGGLDVLRDAVARVAAVTGTTWQYVGATSTTPSAGYLPRVASASYPPVLIGWTDSAASDLLPARPSSTLGMTRTAWFGTQRADGTAVAATRAAVVALDRTDRLPLRGGRSWTAVALHELGHTMGLAHVEEPDQLMAGVLPRAVGDLQSGDRKGLVRLGRAAGCVPVA